MPELSFVAVADRERGRSRHEHVVGRRGVDACACCSCRRSACCRRGRERASASALVRASIDGARRAGEPALLVEGNPKYYGRFGFVRADELGLLPPPEALYDWAFQVAVLDEGVELPRGRVIYSAPFRH